MKPIPTWEERYTNCSLETAMRAEIDALRQRCAELEAEQNICGSGAGCLSKEARIDAAESRCAELEKDAAPCVWSAEDDDNMPGTYASSCGELWTFTEGGPIENGVTFCHHCGNKVELGEQA